jgi:hypothetical protein
MVLDVSFDYDRDSHQLVKTQMYLFVGLFMEDTRKDPSPSLAILSGAWLHLFNLFLLKYEVMISYFCLF